MKDLQSEIGLATSIAPAAITATATGTGVDLLNFNSAVLSLVFGVVTDGTHTVKLQESVDDSTYTDVAAGDLVGAVTVVTSTESNTVQKVGYKGVQRYVRAVSTVAGTTTGGVYAAQIIRGDANLSPVA